MILASYRRAVGPVISLLVVAVSCCFAETSARPAANPYDTKFDTLLRSWQADDDAQKAILLNRMLELREYISQPAQVREQLSRVAYEVSETPLVRDEATWDLSKVALSEGQLDEVKELTDRLGFVRDWNLLEGPCTSAKLDDISHRSRLNVTPLSVVQVPPSDDAACIATAVYSDFEQAIALRFEVDGSASLNVNGTPLLDNAKESGVAFDQHSAGVRLHAGWNVITVEIAAKADRKFALRITHPNGGGVALSVDASRVHNPEFASEPIPVADLLSQAAFRAKSNAPEALEEYADLAATREIDGDLDRRQTIAGIAPTADRWIAVAEACDVASCTFSALNKALALDPTSTQGLADLADYYVDRNQLEKAGDLLKRALANSTEDYVLQKRRADLYFTAGNAEAADEDYRSLQQSGIKSIWLRRELGLHYENAGMSDRAEELLSEAWKLAFDDDAIRGALQRLARARGDVASLRALNQAAIALNPADTQAKFNFAKMENDTGALEKAAATVQSGSDPELRLRYANLLAFAGKTDQSRAELALAAQSDVRIQLPTVSSATDPDVTYLENPARLAATAQRTPPQAAANVVTLADITVERMLASGQTSQHVQQVFYIATERGAQDYGTRNLQYSETSQQLSVVHARIYARDGHVTNAEADGDSPVADASTAMYYDTRARSFRFPSLHKGDVIELEYRIAPKSNRNPYGSYFGSLVAFQTGLPQQLHRYVLIAPGGRQLNIVQERMPKANVAAHNGETIYRWEMRDIAALPNEPRGPSLTEIAPYLSVSTFADWNELGRWYAGFIAPQFALDSDLREALAEITKGAATELDKIRAIHEFVLRNTHYVAMEFGIYSYKPYPVSQVYARRFGDCKDKASLMIALMRAANIDADLALVRTRKLGDVSEQATNISVFNHAVAYVPKYDLWLDGTAEYAGFKELPLDDQGAMALTVNLNGDAALKRIPVTLPMQNYTHRVVRAEVQPDGKIVFSGSAYTRGEDAPGLRREYEIAERQRDTVRANLARVYPSVKVDSVHVDGASDLEHDINVNFSGSLDTFAGHDSLELIPSWLPHKYVDSLAPLSSRKEQLQLPAPWTTEEELHFTIPETAKLDHVPKDWHYDTPYGTALIRYELRGRELVVTTSVQFRKLRIDVPEYAGFREFCQNVEKAFHQEIKVRLAS